MANAILRATSGPHKRSASQLFVARTLEASTQALAGTQTKGSLLLFATWAALHRSGPKRQSRLVCRRRIAAKLVTIRIIRACWRYEHAASPDVARSAGSPCSILPEMATVKCCRTRKSAIDDRTPSAVWCRPFGQSCAHEAPLRPVRVWRRALGLKAQRAGASASTCATLIEEFQANCLRRRRAKASMAPQAAIKPGMPAPTIGPGTLTSIPPSEPGGAADYVRCK